MKQFFAVLIILGIGLGIITFLKLTTPEGETVTPERPVARVNVIEIERQSIPLTIRSQGTVLPEIEIELPIEVSGRIIEMSPKFKVGNRVSANELLFRIDPSDYEAALAMRQAEVARAELTLAQEEAQGQQALADWKTFGKSIEEASPLTLREPQRKQAEAGLASAEAALKQAKRDLERTEVRAPFEGFVLSKNVDLGQFIVASPSSSAGRIYSADRAEIRLPLSEADLQKMGSLQGGTHPVRIFTELSGSQLQWRGTISRTEASVDPTTRLIHVVAQVEAPFDSEPQLRRGTFVQAEIEGRTVKEAIDIPRYALRGSNTVYVVTSDSQLVTREVSVVQATEKVVIIDQGLETGEKVAISPVAFFVENMPVEIIEQP